MAKLSKIRIEKECSFRTSRSSGKGGQNVNKVSSRVEVLFDVASSEELTELQKTLIQKRLKNRINKEGILLLAVEDQRSQLRNKKIAVDRLFLLLKEAIKVYKIRKRTAPNKSSIEKRIKSKKKKAEIKKNRQKPEIN